MLKRLSLLLTSVVIAANAGCGDGKVMIIGKLSQGDKPLAGRVHMVFIPLTTEGKEPAVNQYSANVRPDGSYFVKGKQGSGIPPGKYRIAVTILDRPGALKGTFDKENSPIIRAITAKPSTQTIDIELDRPTE